MKRNFLIVLTDLFQFLKNPKENWENKQITEHKWTSLLYLWVLIMPFMMLYAAFLQLPFIEKLIPGHKLDRVFEDFIPFEILILVVLIAPVSEELLFRMPLKFKRNYLFRWFDSITNKKYAAGLWYTYYPYFFYGLTLLFGYVHITNFDTGGLIFYLLSALFVLPQLILGLILGYARVVMGLKWSILFHAIYNGLIFIPVLILDSSPELVAQKENEEYQLEVLALPLKLDKEIKASIFENNGVVDSILVTNEVLDVVLIKLHQDTSLFSEGKQRLNIEFRNKSGIAGKESELIKVLAETYGNK